MWLYNERTTDKIFGPDLHFLLTGCVPTLEVTKFNKSKYPPKSSNYEMLIMDRASLDKKFKILGEVRNIYKSKLFQSEQSIIQEMKSAARKMGGDALIDFKTRTVNESNDGTSDYNTYYKATVIVFVE